MPSSSSSSSYFHGMASSRKRINRISLLMHGDTRLETREEITAHIVHYFSFLYSREERVRPKLDNLGFATLKEEKAQWLERDFDTEVILSSC